MTNIALIVGSASSLKMDLAQFSWLTVHVDFTVIAVNEAGVHYRDSIHHWVTLHPEHLKYWQVMRGDFSTRQYTTWGFDDKELHVIDRVVPYRWHGSSGLYAVQIALNELNLDRIVLAGIPIDDRAYYGEGSCFPQAAKYQPVWRKHLPELDPYVRSMSGFTANLLGRPTRDWLLNPHYSEA